MALGWPLKKVISGGQTGADQGGLAAGHLLGYEVGGMAPKGYLTETGPAIDRLRDLYNLHESHFASYPPRTRYNIRMSDGTVIFGDTRKGGTRLTLQLCEDLGKPFLVNPTDVVLRSWIVAHDIRVLNVAGNRESKQPGIFLRTFQFLLEALKP